MTVTEVHAQAGTNLFLRHLFFLRFVLGEPFRDAALMARRAADHGWPLTVAQMEHVRRHWHHEPACATCEPGVSDA